MWWQGFSERAFRRRRRPARRRALSLPALAAAGAVWLAGAPVPAGGQELVVYSGRGERFTRPIVEAFQAETGIETEALVGESAQLLNRLDIEAGRTQADVFLTNYAGHLEQARRRDLLQPYRSPGLAEVPETYRAPDHTWTGLTARARVIVYNPQRVQEPPRTMLALAGSRWKDRLGITVSSNASFIGQVSAMLRHEGRPATHRFLEGIKANAGFHVYPAHTPVVSAVARGEVDVGLVNHYYYYRAITQHADLPLEIVYPDQETHGAWVTLSGVGIARHARHVEAARRFVDYLLSRPGQKRFAEVNYEFPVSEPVEAHPLLPERSGLVLAPARDTLKPGAINGAVELIKEVGLQ